MDLLNAETEKLQTARDAEFAQELEAELERGIGELDGLKTQFDEAKEAKDNWDTEKTRLQGVKATADAGDD